MTLKKTLFIIFLLILPISFVRATTKASIRILIVPGHDNGSWGAEYGKIKEADMNLVLATQIYNSLKVDKNYKVYITRNKSGYLKTFADYFSNHKGEIIAFKQAAKLKTKKEIVAGDFTVKEGVAHVAVNEDMSVKLFGINKWANENKIDLVLHVHFNDYPRPSVSTIGTYKGIAIYVPEAQMVNSAGSTKVANSIFKQLKKKYSASSYPKEKSGIVPDQNLIAMGTSGTLNEKVRTVLVEYGYIYEKVFRNTTSRRASYKIMAALTTTGIKNYFGK